jgi:glutathione peroxidase
MSAGEIYDIEVRTIDGRPVKMSEFKGKTLLIVNVASRCGFTPQYKGLENLYRDFKDRGFLVLGFPCNQFGAQEPGSDEEIKSFCSAKYEVSFPMFSKVDVNGDSAHPLYKLLKKAEKGILGTEAIKWNFTKFLVSPAGEVLKRFSPTTAPESIAIDIEKLCSSTK